MELVCIATQPTKGDYRYHETYDQHSTGELQGVILCTIPSSSVGMFVRLLSILITAVCLPDEPNTIQTSSNFKPLAIYLDNLLLYPFHAPNVIDCSVRC
jgi:hypothetical protein